MYRTSATSSIHRWLHHSYSRGMDSWNDNNSECFRHQTQSPKWLLNLARGGGGIGFLSFDYIYFIIYFIIYILFILLFVRAFDSRTGSSRLTQQTTPLINETLSLILPHPIPPGFWKIIRDFEYTFKCVEETKRVILVMPRAKQKPSPPPPPSSSRQPPFIRKRSCTHEQITHVRVGAANA